MKIRHLMVTWTLSIASYLSIQALVFVALSTRPLASTLSLSGVTAALLTLVLTVVYLPVLAGLKHAIPSMGSIAGGVAGSLLFPVPMICLWLFIRESGETWRALLRSIGERPGEALIIGIPLAAAGFVFGALLVPQFLNSPQLRMDGSR